MARNHSEHRLHVCVAEWLWRACPGLLWTHPANEGRSPAEGAKYKRLGVRAGTADILLWFSGKFAAIELKTTTTLSPRQRQFRDEFIRAGGLYAVCKTVASVRDTLIGWGYEPSGYPPIEPPPSKEVLKKLAMDFYRP